MPKDLEFFFEMAANNSLLYLEANSRALAAGAENVSYRAQGVGREIPTTPYRAECFNTLKRPFAALDGIAASELADVLPSPGIELLKGPTIAATSRIDRPSLVARLGRPAGEFG